MTKSKSESPESIADSMLEPSSAEDGVNAPEGESAVEAASPDSIAGLQARIESLENSLLRAKADYQNAQRRSTADRIDAVRFANADLMRSLLNVLDDFDRTLAVAGEATHDNLIEGVRLVYENLQKSLTEHGLETIEAKGEPFDPTIHEALMQQPSDEFAPGTVMEQVTRGYRLRDRVLRPARVVVAKAADDSEAES